MNSLSLLRTPRLARFAALVLSLAGLEDGPSRAVAQPYELVSGRVTSGGGSSASGPYAVHGSLAQSDAGSVAGGTYTALGGFWNLLTLPFLLESGTDEVAVPEGRSIKIPVSALVDNDRSLLGYPVAVVSVDAVTERGGTLSVTGGWLVYRPPAGPSANDRFHYTLSDGGDGPRHAVVGTVELRSGPAPAAEVPPNAVRIAVTHGNVELAFIGVPGRSYRIQYAVETTPAPHWLEFAPAAVRVAEANGVFRFTDVAPPEANRLYRAVAATTP